MLSLENVSKVYKVGTFGGTDLPAVRDVSFDVGTGEIVSLIGESGSGKSTIGRMILRLIGITGGTITFDGANVAALGGSALKDYYRRVQGVFQDPFSSYNPIFKADRVFAMVREGFYPEVSEAAWRTKVGGALESVNLIPDQVLNKYPHQLSGGQLQRLLIARALLLDIRLLVADELISMLDASTRIDVLNLLGELRSRGLGILFITHDLSLGYYSSQRTVILSRGVIVEMGSTQRVYANPLHPYTRTLLASVPQLRKRWSEVENELGVGEAAAAPACVYHAARPKGTNGTGARGLVEAEPDHFVACSGAPGGTCT